MTRIESTFAELTRKSEKGFIAYITAGDPSMAATVDFVLRLEEAGVDLVELGIPFSDPLADGRVNQLSAARALEAGATPAGVFDAISKIRKHSQVPILCYTYMNPILAGGFDKTVAAASRAGMDGLLLLDLPVEEMGPYALALERNKLNNICLVTPTSPMERIRKITAASTGFVYCVSRTGVTGMQKTVQASAGGLIKQIKTTTRLPVALGFGVSNPQTARAAAEIADAVVVGSAIVDKLNSEPHTPAGRQRAADWVGSLVKAVKSAR